MAERVEGEYGAEQIQVLDGLEHIRKRPGMYISSTDAKGLHHLVHDVVDNSFDEALAGYCTHIEVSINDDGSCTVQDNGRGRRDGGKCRAVRSANLLRSDGKSAGEQAPNV